MMLAKFWDLKCCLKKLESMGRYPGLSELASTVLYSRGYPDLESARDVFADGGFVLHDPFLLSGMREGADTVRRAVEDRKNIVVYGDYDVDGITSTYLVSDYLSSLGASCSYRIPDRISNGYGITCAMIDDMKKDGAELIITVDNGITAADEIDYARSLGIEVVVTDHHECPVLQGARLPDAEAVINPLKPGDPYPFKHLAGVGVAFKLIAAVDGDQEKIFSRYADVIAVGTVADVMELKDENRLIVAEGLKKLENTDNCGLAALLDASGARSKRISSSTVNFTLAPRINAAGRLSRADVAVELLKTDSLPKARDLADMLCELNFQRQESENELLSAVESMLSRDGFLPERDKAIVLWGDDWCGGITGIVCSRLMCEYGVPVILMTVEDGVVKGSGRSLPGFNLYEALSSLSDCLEKFGGHALAAGLTMTPEKLPEFKERFLAYAEKVYESTDVRPILTIDSEIRARSLSVENVEGLAALEPYGNGWPAPVFAMFGVRILEATPVGNRKHMRLTIEKCGVTLTAMLFRVTPEEFALTPGDLADIAFMLDISTFRREKQIQLITQDIRPCESAGKSGYELYQRFNRGEELNRCEITAMRPQRDDFVALWKYLRRYAAGKSVRIAVGDLNLALRRYENRDVTAVKLYVSLAVFQESGLLSFELDEGGRIVIHPVSDLPKEKIDLEASSIMQRLN
ncbi:MAG: single-stranded-DNA-specific exonuclease RecJ [Clostridia bacterium]|nr:single-stranded-DNA-specific exonuclease RecJ [Clostridia bacterium]